MFRQSVRQAMKSITLELEGMQRNVVTSADTCSVAARIGSVVQLIAEVLEKVHLVSSVANEMQDMLVSTWIYRTS